MQDVKTYYAEETRKDMLELSDRHVLWRVNIPNEASEARYYRLCEISRAKLSEHYHTPIGFYGRSGRHVCVEDTTANRRNYRHLVKAVKREQDKIIKHFADTAN